MKYSSLIIFTLIFSLTIIHISTKGQQKQSFNKQNKYTKQDQIKADIVTQTTEQIYIGKIKTSKILGAKIPNVNIKIVERQLSQDPSLLDLAVQAYAQVSKNNTMVQPDGRMKSLDFTTVVVRADQGYNVAAIYQPWKNKVKITKIQEISLTSQEIQTIKVEHTEVPTVQTPTVKKVSSKTK